MGICPQSFLQGKGFGDISGSKVFYWLAKNKTRTKTGLNPWGGRKEVKPWSSLRFVFIGNPIRRAIVSVWIIVFLVTTNHGTYLPFSWIALLFLGPNHQSCSRAQPEHPEMVVSQCCLVQHLFWCIFGPLFSLPVQIHSSAWWSYWLPKVWLARGK